MQESGSLNVPLETSEHTDPPNARRAEQDIW